jgi:hypothetical protein
MIFRIAGQASILPVTIDTVLLNDPAYCLDMHDWVGANGNADRYVCGADREMGAEKASMNLLASITKSAVSVPISCWQDEAMNAHG